MFEKVTFWVPVAQRLKDEQQLRRLTVNQLNSLQIVYAKCHAQ